VSVTFSGEGLAAKALMVRDKWKGRHVNSFYIWCHRGGLGVN